MIKNKNIGKEVAYIFLYLKCPLKMLSEIDAYKEDKKDIDNIIDTLDKWEMGFYKERNLNFVTPEELLDVYYKLEELNEKYFLTSTNHPQDGLFDEAYIWMWKLMLLRKDIIENMEGNKDK